MKSKKSIYILLPVVLLIWGSVVYQFFSFSKSEPVANESNDFTFSPIQFKARDTFAINVNYRDPFLGKMYNGENQTKRNPLKTSKHVVKTPVVMQSVIYKGIVSDTKGKHRIFMLIINGRTFLMEKGDTESEVFLKEGNRESITIKNKGTLQTIPLQV